ncbi:SET and MYND domain-containing protein 4-like [Tetranychus urticae]|uniref:SET and MYND domain-containing protein 4-like n=1 Tax=Tetranychus urticae TaxID=32264 RepID=UPI000D648584|nr:SET and MYND domain-containing protein 4-like [Tetranychus urticae]
MSFPIQDEVSKELIHTLNQWAVSAGIDVDSFLEKFNSLSPDDDRVSTMLLEQSLVDCFTDRMKAALLDNSDERLSKYPKCKSDQKAKEFRLKGNKYYSDKQFGEAHNCYTQAIRFAVDNGSTEDNQLCLSYANRSAINYECERWKEAINDIDMAIKHGYPQEKIDKLLKRKLKCLDKLKIARDVLPPDNQTNEDEVSKLVESLKLDLDDIEEIEEPVIEKVNPEIPNASMKVSITYDPKKGRGLKANETINFGEILVKDVPYAHALFSDCYDDYVKIVVNHLMDLACLVQFAQYCHPLIPNINDPLIQLVLRLMTKSLMEQNSQSICENRSDQIYYSDYSSIKKLAFSPTISSDLVLASLFLSILIQTIYPSSTELKSLPSLKSLVSLSLLHFHQLLINKTFLVHNEDSVVFSTLSPHQANEKIGLAIYPTMSLVNHSCQPNSFLFFFHEKVIIRASQTIESGQELSICYGPSYQSHTLADRRKKLRDWYYFDCNCNACSKSLESTQICYKCPRCEGPLIVNEDGSNNCLSCKQEDILPIEIKKSVEDALADMEKGRNSYESSEYDDAIQLLSKSYNTMDDYLYRSNWNLLRSRTFLYECLASMGHYEMAAKLCAVNVNVTKEIHGNESVDYVISMITYLGLMYKDLEDIVTEDLTKAELKANQIIHLVDEQIDRLVRIAQLANTSSDPTKVFHQEMNNLKAIKEQCQRIDQYINSQSKDQNQ